MPPCHYPRADKGVIADNSAHVDGGINPGLYVIADDSPQLTPLGVDAAYMDILLVESQVGNLGAGAEIAAFADNAIADVVQMRHIGAAHDDGIFYLDEGAYMAVVADGGRGADIAVWAGAAIIADNDGAFDIW